MVDGAGAHPPDGGEVLVEFDRVTDFGRAGVEGDAVFFALFLVAHSLGEEADAVFGASGGHLNSVESVNCVFGLDVIPCGLRIGLGDAGNEFELEAVVVLELEDRVAKLFNFVEREFGLAESVDPVGGCALRDSERHDGGLSQTGSALGGVGPGEKGEEGARGAFGVAVVEVVGAGVVVVDSDFDEAQAENSGVEVHVALGVAAHGSDVVDALDAVGHVVNNETMRFVVPEIGFVKVLSPTAYL